MIPTLLSRRLWVITALSLFSQPVLADPDITSAQITSEPDMARDSELGFRAGSFIVAPIPFSTPTIGSGLTLAGGYLFKLDENAETSYVGFGLLRSDNGSSAYGLSTKLSLGSGWDFDLTVANADLNYDLFVGSIGFPITQNGVLANGGLSRKVSEDWKIGATFRYLETRVSPDFLGSLPPILQPDLKLELVSLGVTADWDTRDDTDYPSDGALLNVVVSHFAETDGSRDYQQAYANFSYYASLRESTVFAARGSACAASAAAAFFDKCSLGFTDRFRGFSPTRYYDDRLVSGQAELRHRLSNRFGAVAFAGVGWTGPKFSGLIDDNARVAGGVGLRYRLSQKFPVDFSVDYTTNNDKEDILYIFIGQRF